MKEFINIYGCLALAFVFGMLIRPAARDKWTPFMFAYMLWWYVAGSTFTVMMHLRLYQVLWLMQFVPMAFLLSGFRPSQWRNNGAITGFIVFFTWFFLTALWGEGNLMEVLKVHFGILRMVVIGIVVGSWVLSKPDGLMRLLRAVSIAAFFAALLYAKYGSWSATALADAGGRMVVDTSELVGDADQIAGAFNVNRFALLGTVILPFPFLFMLENWRIKKEKLLKCVAIVSILILTLVVIKTGSRNGGAGLLPLVWYFVFAKTSLKGPKKIAIMLVFSIAMTGLVFKVMQGNELRVFKFTEEKGTTIYEIGTGRGAIFANWYNGMKDFQHAVGAGVPWGELREDGTRRLANCHSMYMNIFVQSGYVGLVLLGLFGLSVVICSFRRHDRFGRVAILLVTVWFLTGLGEAANIFPENGYGKFCLGIAIALCSRRKFQTDVFYAPAHYPANRYWA